MSTEYTKPSLHPHNARFSSGPCSKRPDWSFKNLDTSVLGRSHRAGLSKKMMKEIVDRTHSLLSLPADYKVGITPGSATGAIELAMWNLLGAEGIGCDAFAWEEFSGMWLRDVMEELQIPNARAFQVPYGQLPDFNMMDPNRDAVFAWNGTTSGACVPNGNAIPKGDKGLRICDATSAAFMYELPWDKLDVVTWSWQKCAGAEAAHGMIAMSPKAIQRLRDYKPKWPMPKLFKLRTATGVDEAFFDGVFINTPSMMCIADILDALNWIDSIGGRPGIQQRISENVRALDQWVQKTDWVDYLTENPEHRSKTSICLRYTGKDFLALDTARQQKVASLVVELLEQEKAGYDLNAYKTAPLGLRIWCGTTIETADIKALCPWLEWAYHTALAKISAN